MHSPRWLGAMLICVLLTACGSGEQVVTATAPAALNPADPATSGWPVALPQDGVQPWEQTDSAGKVVPAPRAASAINGQSSFTAGVDAFSSGGNVIPFGEASHLDAGGGGDRLLSYAVYRLTLGGVQPGVVSVDANLGTAGSSYYVGLSDYSTGHWHWHGPFSDTHIRLVKVPGQLDSPNYLSPLGNLFAAVAIYNGGSVDVMGVGANPQTDGDAAAPPAPSAFSATPVSGGFLLEWTPSAAGDLAGYRVLWGNSGFTAPTDNGIQTYKYADGGGRLFLPRVPQRYTFIALQAIDIAGNASPLTKLVDAVPLRGGPPPLTVTPSVNSVFHDKPITLTATGAASYDFDLDGDGVYDVTGDTTGTAQVDTSKTGIIRPSVRGHSADGLAVALGGVSLVVTGNTRPAVSASVIPQSGLAPLLVAFTADAQDAEDPAGTLTYAWDFDGDGIYETGTNVSNPQHTYSTAGTFNAKVRVTDSQGAWGVDTLTINATGNSAPTVSAVATPQSGTCPLDVTFTATASDKEDLPAALTYAWDFDGDGVYEAGTNQPSLVHSYATPGVFNATVRVTDSLGAKATYPVTIVATAANQLPVPLFSVAAQQQLTPLKLLFNYDAGASTDPDGGPLRFDWDFDGDGTYDLLHGPAQVTRSFTIPGRYPTKLRLTDAAGGTALLTQPVYVPSVWSSIHGDPSTGTRQSPVVGAQNNHVKWSYPTGNTIVTNPVVGPDGTIIVSSTDNSVYALKANGTLTPTLKWKFTTGDQIFSSPAIGPDGTVYVGSDDTKLYALIDNGTLAPTVRWTFNAGALIFSSPVVGPDGTVYIGTNAPDSSVYALVDSGGAAPLIKWHYSAGGSVSGNPALGTDGTVYVSCDDGFIYALTDNGSPIPTLKWSYNSGAASSSGPTVGLDGLVYAGNNNGTVVALQGNGTGTPTVHWSYTTGGAVTSTPAIGTDGTVYIGSGDNVVYALKDVGTATPGLKWSYATGNKVPASATVGADGTVYIGSRDNTFYAFIYDGTVIPLLKWNYKTGAQVRSSPAIGADGTVYVGGGSVAYAFGS